eukprot:TRINITY_DN5270_c0_g1_i1.p1 TRINITY_DN5270_c0_g1~~TRINITY_DN5270_c0_g1_i1.p1  ORF type:complete len:102 (-),score=0.07 TRINITY_DN5270_c0_g1_i1:174-449(-)
MDIFLSHEFVKLSEIHTESRYSAHMYGPMLVFPTAQLLSPEMIKGDIVYKPSDVWTIGYGQSQTHSPTNSLTHTLSQCSWLPDDCRSSPIQ